METGSSGRVLLDTGGGEGGGETEKWKKRNKGRESGPREGGRCFWQMLLEGRG